MDLIVYTNGSVRNVSGVNESTTCAQVVYALAHATNQKGRFVLVATFSNSNQEHRLAPNESPYQLVQKCGQLDANVTFELRKIDSQIGGQEVLKNGERKENHDNASPSTSLPSPPGAALPNNGSGGGDGDAGGGASPKDLIGDVGDIHVDHNRRHHQQFSRHFASVVATTSYSDLPDVNALSSSPTTVESHQNLTSSAAMLGNDPPHRPPLQKAQSRPPPPAYDEVIEQRCHSLTRNASLGRSGGVKANAFHSTNAPSFSTILNLTVNDLLNRKFSRDEFEKFVETQCRVIAAQKNELLSLELTLSNDAEREMVQLKKQYNNLQTVLNSLRNANWADRVLAEREEAERLHTAIDAMKTAIENKREELQQFRELERAMEMQLAFEEDALGRGGDAKNCSEMMNQQQEESARTMMIYANN